MQRLRSVGLGLIVVVALVGLLWMPVTLQVDPMPQPAADYAAALARLAQLQARDGGDLFPECHTQLLSHGEPTAQVLVLFHGVTSCPAQLEPFGRNFFDRGYNVLIPRLPHHGVDDPWTTAVADLTAEELAAAVDEAVDIAAGLGETVVVGGFSTGGTMAAWAAQTRPEVDRAVLLSAFLSPRAYPAWTIRPLMRTLLVLPNQFWWWDPTLHENAPRPRYTYFRYPTHAMAQIMRLSFATQQRARSMPPASAAILVVLNAAATEDVDNAVTSRLATAWQAAGSQVTIYELDAGLELKHNYVDPQMTTQPVDVVQTVHPGLVEAIDQLAQQPP